MTDSPGAVFVVLIIGFAACVLVSVGGRLAALQLRRRGRPELAARVTQWSARFGLWGAAFLFFAGVVFFWLSR